MRTFVVLYLIWFGCFLEARFKIEGKLGVGIAIGLLIGVIMAVIQDIKEIKRK